ncbi:Aminotransferase, class IV [Marinomonas sp. MED121]|uniref:aminodeoxychorismate lyase n=1 Tax=Marinomonas sp. MED121 TaxID=314277 RepID=UPI0000690140|nr:aminodeoxychorismate lyase [Marinomonas sp. MED121]EAQ63288.1 Aminotransferase, class IV [Marinomonas sp. MED121]
MTWFINYLETNEVAVTDRGFAYGDGVFETLLLDQDKILLADFHKARLTRACHRLCIPFTQDELDKAFSFVQQQSQGRQCAKIIVTRGSGGRGYLPPNDPNVTLVIGFMDAPSYQSLADLGVRLSVSPINASINASVAGLKHLNRLENVLAKQAQDKVNQVTSEADFFESILLDDDGVVIECIQSNLFWFKNDTLYTPLLNRSGVQGTLRANILASSSTTINVGRFTLKDVLGADEVFICNSLMSVVPVTCIQSHFQHDFVIGKNTKRLQSLMKLN